MTDSPSMRRLGCSYRVEDIDLNSGLLTVRRQTYPGRRGLVTKETKGRPRRSLPIIEPLRDSRAQCVSLRGLRRPASVEPGSVVSAARSVLICLSEPGF